ncbi:MAG: PD-(D/E)XK nuclease family protein [Holosporaceae bacterium]|jgi:hypothetical protein|nr:PD-(D/E)XK nuclease family protein [Holosporaceae bacterium]
MSIVYNVPLTKRFLPEVADFFRQKKVGPAKIFLPDRRSCQMLKQHLITGNIDTMMLPLISAISDEFFFDEHRITALLMQRMTRYLKRENISVDVIFELSKGLSSLLKDLVLADVAHERLAHMVPEQLQDYWHHTLEMLQECMRSEELQDIMRFAKIKFATFLESIPDQQAIAVGIENTNYYQQSFLQRVLESENGILFITGNENENFRNYQMNRELFERYAPNAVLNLEIASETAPETATEIAPAFAEFPSSAEEALGVSLAVRRALHAKQSVLIVSRDPRLSEKIKMELGRWNIVPSYNVQFSKTRCGMLVSLVADMIDREFDLPSVLNVLKFTGKYGDFSLSLELFCRNKSYLPKKFFDVIAIYNKKYPSDIIDALKNLAFGKSETTGDIHGKEPQGNDLGKTFRDWFDYTNNFVKLLDQEASQQLEHLAEPFCKYSDLLGKMNVSEFVIFLKNQLLTIKVPPPQKCTDDVVILEATEVQLLDADVVIIAGANEDNLRVSEKNDFWMSKSMLNTLGIPTAATKNASLQRIFERLVHKPNTLITRSRIVDGVQQQRYTYLDKIADQLRPERDLENFVAGLLYSLKKESIKFRAPTPDLKHRPNSFFVSDLAQLRNNAYVFYAKKILNLKELNARNNPRKLRGNYVHKVLDTIVKTAQNKNDLQEAITIAQDVMENMYLDESDFGPWFFRLKNILAYACENLDSDSVVMSEINGSCIVSITPDYSCKIHCRADRIDQHPDKSISIIDYKMSLPTKKKIEDGYKPQLCLEAIIAQKDGFSLETTKIKEMYFLCVDGSNKTGQKCIVGKSPEATERLVLATLTGFVDLIKQYNVIGIPYDLDVNDEYATAYLHLARAKEWSDI